MADDHPDRDLASWRLEYEDRGLTEADLPADPVAGIAAWLDDASRAGVHEPNAMVLASADPDGVPSARLVLLKGIDDRGLVFYTNLESRKGRELVQRPACSLLFPWHPLERQVRVEGIAEVVDPAEADAYFASRPRGSQLGAWASPQSAVVSGRDELARRYDEAARRFAAAEQVPRPPQWGGFRVRPSRVEFWQGRPGRMHDRLLFTRGDAGAWEVRRLAP